METRFEDRFNRSVRRIRNRDLLRRIRRAIENVESADRVTEIRSIKRMSARVSFYHIRVGDHRIGLRLERNVAVFIKFGHRNDFYRDFP